MANMIKTSVIIPVYNTVEYLEECVESVLAQTQKEIEIFLIDDGSTDGSLEIIDRYVSEYPFIYKITQEHEYQGTARNRGLERARGKYVYFMDSDYAILPDLFETCYDLCERMSLDYAIFDAYGFRYDENDVELKVPDDIFDRTVLGIEDRVYRGPEFWNSFYNSHGILYLCWLHYIRRDFLLKNELFYEERTYFEDNDWTLRMYMDAERLYYIPRQLHRHRWRRNSNMLGGFTAELMKGCFRMHWVLLGLYRRCKDAEQAQMIRDVIRLNICRFDRLAEVEPVDAYRLPLKKFFTELCEAMKNSSLESSDMLLHFAVAERVVHGTRFWKCDPEEFRKEISGVFRFAFPHLWDDSRIGIYGTGRVGGLITDLLDLYAPDRRCSLFFINSKDPTGSLFNGYDVYNVLDASEQLPDLIIIGSAIYKESIQAQIREHIDPAVPVMCIPWEVCFLQENKKDISSRKMEVSQCDKPAGIVVISDYIGWRILKSFPGLLNTNDDAFSFRRLKAGLVGMDVLKDRDIYISAGLSSENGKRVREFLLQKGVPSERIRNVSDLLAECLLLWEPVHFTPEMIHIDASTRCQLNCPGCYMRRDDNGTMGKGDLCFDNFKKLLDENPSVKTVELSKSGELFLNPELHDILRYSYEKGVRTQISNGTNLNYVSDQVLEDLVRYQVGEIKVALDGATQEVYQLYRRGGNIENVYSNIIKIKEYKEKYESDYPELIWQFILMNENQHEAEAAAKKAEELGMKMHFILDYRGGFVPDDPEKLQRLTGMRFLKTSEYDMAEKHEYNSDDYCRQMILTPQINWDGRLLGCCTVYQRDWGINVFERPLSEIFNDTDYRSAAIDILLGRDKMDHSGPCRKCLIYRNNVINNIYALRL